MADAQQLITDQLEIWTSIIKARSSSGRGSNKKREIYGIRRLRELILNLAVRGVLVEQDNEEEPAHETLARIAKTKELLTKTNKTRKTKTLPSIKEEELPFPIPPSWAYTRIDDLNNPLRPLTYGVLKPGPNTKDGIPLIKTENIQFRTIKDRFSTKISRELDQEYSRTRISGGEILLTLVGSIGRCAIASKNLIGSNLSRSVGMLVTMEETSSEFLLLALRALINDQYISNNCAGTAQKVLNISKVRSLVIGFPPLAEQHRIVAKVDELMAICDQLEEEQENNLETHETLAGTLLNALTSAASDAAQFAYAWERIQDNFDILFTTASSVDQLKQSILQLAVMGKIVPQDPEDEPGDELLKRITASKIKLINTGLLKRQKVLPPVSDEEKTYAIPENWAWTRLNDAFDIRDGTHDSPQDAIGDNTYPLITSKDFKKGKINFEGSRRISSKDHFEICERSCVEVNDILFSMIGGNIGNQVIVEDPRPFSIKNVALFKYYNSELTSPRFLKIYSEELALKLQQKASGGAQPFVSLGYLRKLLFALPPLSEQHRIVAKVDELMALCEQLKANLTSAQETQLNLADSLVEQAIK